MKKFRDSRVALIVPQLQNCKSKSWLRPCKKISLYERSISVFISWR